MSELDISTKASLARSKPAMAALFIGILILGACIPSTVNRVAAVSPVSVVNAPGEHLSLNGRVESDEIKLAMVMPGTVADVAVREGQHVSKGQVLVRLNSADAEIENDLKAIDQVIAATEKMKSRAELLLAEVKNSRNSVEHKSVIGPRKTAVARRKNELATNASSKKVIDSNTMLNSPVDSEASQMISKQTQAAGDTSVAPSTASDAPSSNRSEVTPVAALSSNSKDFDQADTSTASTSMVSTDANAAPSITNDAVAGAAAVPTIHVLSKKELKEKYKNQLAKINKNEKERRKNLKMGYALVQALADSKAKGSKSVLASEDLKAAGFTDILKGEILRSGMVDPSQLFSAQLANLKTSGASSDLLKDPKVQAQLAKLAEKNEASAVPANRDLNLVAADLSKLDADSLTQLLKSHAITIDQSTGKQDSKNASSSRISAKASPGSPALSLGSFDAAKLQALFYSNQQVSIRENSKADVEAFLKNAQSLSGSRKLSTLQIETDIAKADAEIAKAKALRQELLSKRNASILTSPVDGIISARNINPGEIVLPGRILIRISAPDRFYVRAFIPEGQLSKIKMGQKATVYLDGEKNRPLTATVSAIDSEPSFTPENVYFKEDRVRQVFGIKLRIDNSNGAAKNGMPADAIVFLFEPKA